MSEYSVDDYIEPFNILKRIIESATKSIDNKEMPSFSAEDIPGSGVPTNETLNTCLSILSNITAFLLITAVVNRLVDGKDEEVSIDDMIIASEMALNNYKNVTLDDVTTRLISLSKGE